MEFRTVYTERKPKKGFVFTQPSRTKQDFADECNINRIMDKYATTGVVTHLAAGHPIYGDFSNVMDYRESLEVVMNAEERFMSMPSDLRKRFDNDPAKMIDFIMNPANREECVKLGFIVDNSAGSVVGNSGGSVPEPAGKKEDSE